MARVLLINDEADLIDMCEIVLEKHGHATQHTLAPYDMGELAALAEWRPELVLLDLVMPSAPGEDVLQRLRGLPGMADIPVIVMSAIPDGAKRAEAMGAIAFLEKPFDPDGLMRAVDRVLAEDRAPRSLRRDPSPDTLRQTSHR